MVELARENSSNGRERGRCAKKANKLRCTLYLKIIVQFGVHFDFEHQYYRKTVQLCRTMQITDYY